jgi:hypothetical protein
VNGVAPFGVILVPRKVIKVVCEAMPLSRQMYVAHLYMGHGVCIQSPGGQAGVLIIHTKVLAVEKYPIVGWLFAKEVMARAVANIPLA